MNGCRILDQKWRMVLNFCCFLNAIYGRLIEMQLGNVEIFLFS